MKIWRIIVPSWLVVIILVCAGWVCAALYMWVITVSVDVTDGVKDVIVYEDALCTEKWLDETIGMEGNHAWVETVYVKNEGTADINVRMMAQGNTAFGFVIFVPSDSFTLAPQEAQPVEVSLL